MQVTTDTLVITGIIMQQTLKIVAQAIAYKMSHFKLSYKVVLLNTIMICSLIDIAAVPQVILDIHKITVDIFDTRPFEKEIQDINLEHGHYVKSTPSNYPTRLFCCMLSLNSDSSSTIGNIKTIWNTGNQL